MKRLALIVVSLVTLGLGTAREARALDGTYLGVQVGAVGPLGSTAAYNSSFGGGLEVGFFANPIVELRLRGLYANMGGAAGGPSVRLLAGTVSGEFHLIDISDIELVLGAGPGFYNFNNGASESVFGLQGGLELVMKLDEGVRIGFGFRVHAPISATVGSTLFTALVSLGYQFGG